MTTSTAGSDLATLVDNQRRRAFVGRTTELAAFEALLEPTGRCRVLFLHGAGGIGKSTLLQQFRLLAEHAGRSVRVVDGHDVDCSPDGMRSALADTDDSLLLIDGYEKLAELDDWIRERLLRSLPATTRVVIAGREAPALAWRTDPGWRAVTRAAPLSALDRRDSNQLLRRAGVPSGQRRRLVTLGSGHPLTLALLADSAASAPVPTDLADAPDLVARLVGQVVEEAPDDDHALAMSLCAHTWLTTKDLLDEGLGRDASDVWAWLEGRPWVTRGTYGVYPHDLVREVLDADLRRRSPATYQRVNRIVHLHAWAAMRGPDSTERWVWAHQKLFLHRRSVLAAAFWQLRSRGSGVIVPGRPEHHDQVAAMVRQYEGDGSAALARRWLVAQPEGLAVAETPTGIEGFCLTLAHSAARPARESDPLVRTLIDHVERTGPLRPGEELSIGRFIYGRTGLRDPNGVVAAAVSSTLVWLTRPVARSLCATTDPDYWGQIFGYIGFREELTADVPGQHYTVFGTDWRRLPPELWFDMLGERELSGEIGPPPEHLLRPAPLPRQEFAAALRQALRDLRQPDRLQENPLLGSRLAADVDIVSIRRLCETIAFGVAALRDEPRGETLARVLDRTFLRPAASQEAAAEMLDLPFSTYRRYLSTGVGRLTEVLWAVEIGAVPLGLRPPARTEQEVDTI